MRLRALVLVGLLAWPGWVLAQESVPKWLIAHQFPPDLANDDKLAVFVSKYVMRQLQGAGAVVATEQEIEEARSTLGLEELARENLSNLSDKTEADHALLVTIHEQEGKLLVAVHRYDVITGVLASAEKLTNNAAVKRTLRKKLTELLKSVSNDRLAEDANAESAEARMVGMTLKTLLPKVAKERGLSPPKGVLIEAVAEGGAAQRSGLLADDIITKVGRKRMKNPGDLAALLLHAGEGESLAMDVWRDGSVTKVELVLGPQAEAESGTPSADAAQAPTETSEPLQTSKDRRLGVRVAAITQAMADDLGLPTPTGALVTVVKPNGPAARAHIMANDVILSFGETPISHARHLLETVIATYPLQRVRAGVWRDRRGVDIDVEFDDQPRDAEAAVP